MYKTTILPIQIGICPYITITLLLYNLFIPLYNLFAQRLLTAVISHSSHFSAFLEEIFFTLALSTFCRRLSYFEVFANSLVFLETHLWGWLREIILTSTRFRKRPLFRIKNFFLLLRVGYRPNTRFRIECLHCGTVSSTFPGGEFQEWLLRGLVKHVLARQPSPEISREGAKRLNKKVRKSKLRSAAHLGWAPTNSIAFYQPGRLVLQCSFYMFLNAKTHT